MEYSVSGVFGKVESNIQVVNQVGPGEKKFRHSLMLLWFRVSILALSFPAVECIREGSRSLSKREGA